MPSRNGHNTSIPPNANPRSAATFSEFPDLYPPLPVDNARRRPSHLQNAPAMAPMSSSMPISPRRGHNRSISHPFTSPFSGLGKKKPTAKQAAWDSDSDSDEVSYLTKPSATSPRKDAPKGGAGNDFIEGKCQTCNSTVRWPRQSQVFRCTNCLMVTDLDTEIPKRAKEPDATDFSRLRGREKPLPPVPSEEKPAQPLPDDHKTGIY